jgi:hypothetical protein
MRGTTSIYERLINDLSILVAKAFIAKVQFELISAIFLLSRYFRLFQQYRPEADMPIGGLTFAFGGEPDVANLQYRLT